MPNDLSATTFREELARIVSAIAAERGGKPLGRLRQLSGLSQGEASARAGVDAARIAAAEDGVGFMLTCSEESSLRRVLVEAALQTRRMEETNDRQKTRA